MCRSSCDYDNPCRTAEYSHQRAAGKRRRHTQVAVIPGYTVASYDGKAEKEGIRTERGRSASVTLNSIQIL